MPLRGQYSFETGHSVLLRHTPMADLEIDVTPTEEAPIAEPATHSER